jgi:Cu(I)/Ag(I) efflux system membrane protein CusA/SilA
MSVVVDDGIVMVENAYRSISERQEEMDTNQ